MTDALSFPLSDSLDHQILMHLEAHFSGSFSEMLSYYKKGGKGVQNDFSIKQIQKLQKLSEKSDEKLSDEILFEEEKEHVKKAKQKYQLLKEAYQKPEQKASQLIADLIFSENEDPQKEINALIEHHKTKDIVPFLIQLLQSEEFYDPLYPGYGKAPEHAVYCLGMLKDERAILPLYQVIGKTDFSIEEEALAALRKIGPQARDVLITKVSSLPLSKENENAALALLQFEEEKVAKVFLQMLQIPNISSFETLLIYLILGCTHLKDEADQELFKKISTFFSKNLSPEIQMVISKWKKPKK